jgi:hypothetical protein
MQKRVPEMRKRKFRQNCLFLMVLGHFMGFFDVNRLVGVGLLAASKRGK